MSKSSKRSKDRFEARYSSMEITQKGQGDIYNVMLDRLSKAIENGEVTMDDSSRTHAEQAHILLQKAASQLISKQQQQQQQKGKNKSSSSSSKPLQGVSKSERRQLAAKWAKENPTGAPSPDMISPRSQQLSHTPDYGRRRYDPDNESSDEEEEDGRKGGDSDSEEEEEAESSGHYGSDDSETGQEIHNTRKLLKGAASRLQKGGGNLRDEGVNNEIYDQLMEELNIGEQKQDRPMRRSELRAQAAAGVRPTLERGPDQVSRRAYAAEVLIADKTRDQQNLPGILRTNTTPSERRTNALDILKNIQQQRRSSNPEMINRLQQSANPVLQSPAHSIRSGGSSMLSSPVPSLTGSQQSHGSGDSISRSSTSGRNRQQHRRRSLEHSSHHGHSASQSGRSGRRKSRDGAKLDKFLVSGS